jgi:hypothetical protein
MEYLNVILPLVQGTLTVANLRTGFIQTFPINRFSSIVGLDVVFAVASQIHRPIA